MNQDLTNPICFLNLHCFIYKSTTEIPFFYNSQTITMLVKEGTIQQF